MYLLLRTRLDEHSSHGNHGQTAVVQLSGELQLTLSRILEATQPLLLMVFYFVRGFACTCLPRYDLKQQKCYECTLHHCIYLEAPGSSCPSSQCQSCLVHLKSGWPSWFVDTCHFVSGIASIAISYVLYFMQTCSSECRYSLLQKPRDHTCHRQSHPGIGPAHYKKAKVENQPLWSTPTAKS